MDNISKLWSRKKGLGRWSWLRIEGNNEINTIVIVAYFSWKPREISLLSTYAQQQKYWTNSIHGCTKDFLIRSISLYQITQRQRR